MNCVVYLIFYRDIARMKITVTVGRMKIVRDHSHKLEVQTMRYGVKKLFLLIIFLKNALINKNASTEVLYFYKDSESMFSFLNGNCYAIDYFGGGGWWVVGGGWWWWLLKA